MYLQPESIKANHPEGTGKIAIANTAENEKIVIALFVFE